MDEIEPPPGAVGAAGPALGGAAPADAADLPAGPAPPDGIIVQPGADAPAEGGAVGAVGAAPDGMDVAFALCDVSLRHHKFMIGAGIAEVLMCPVVGGVAGAHIPPYWIMAFAPFVRHVLSDLFRVGHDRFKNSLGWLKKGHLPPPQQLSPEEEERKAAKIAEMRAAINDPNYAGSKATKMQELKQATDQCLIIKDVVTVGAQVGAVVTAGLVIWQYVVSEDGKVDGRYLRLATGVIYLLRAAVQIAYLVFCWYSAKSEEVDQDLIV